MQFLIKTILQIQLIDNLHSVMMAYNTDLPFQPRVGTCIRIHKEGEVYVIKDALLDMPVATLDVLFESIESVGVIKQHLDLGWRLEM